MTDEGSTTLTHNDYPPVSTHWSELEIALVALMSAVPEHSAIYVSAPITSGRRLAEWRSTLPAEFNHNHPDYWTQHTKEVVVPNTASAKPFVAALRARGGAVVIDPTALPHIPSWTQADYRALWGEVIRRFVGTIMFLDGWAHSAGCAYEYLVAYQSQIPAVDISNRPLTATKARDQLQRAIDELRSTGLEVNFHLAVLDELSSLAAKDQA
jgi:hypothetical protein